MVCFPCNPADHWRFHCRPKICCLQSSIGL